MSRFRATEGTEGIEGRTKCANQVAAAIALRSGLLLRVKPPSLALVLLNSAVSETTAQIGRAYDIAGSSRVARIDRHRGDRTRSGKRELAGVSGLGCTTQSRSSPTRSRLRKLPSTRLASRYARGACSYVIDPT